MPAFLVPIIAEIGVALHSAFVIMYAAEIASATMLLGGLAYSSSQQKKAKRKVREQFNASQVDRLVNVSSSVAARELVLGRVRKGGTVFFRGTTGTNNTTFLMAVALAGHEVDAVETLYLNDVAVTVDGSGNVTSAPYALTKLVSVTETFSAAGTYVLGHTPVPESIGTWDTTSGGGEAGTALPVSYTLSGSSITLAAGAAVSYQYQETTSKCTVRYVLGTDSQSADARMMALFPTLWTADHKASAVAYAIIECTYDETAFPNGLPTATVVLRGAKVYDPRNNLCPWSEDFSDASWTGIVTKSVTSNTATAPDGTLTADTLSDLDAAQYTGIRRSITIASDAQTRCISVFVKKTAGGTSPTFGINASLSGGTGVSQNIRLNTDTGAVTTGGGLTPLSEDYGSFWRVAMFLANNSTNTTLTMDFYGATSAFGGGLSDSATATGSNVIWGAMMNVGTAPGPYCRTAGSAVTPVTAWTQNPALHMRHVYQHPQFGKATVSSDEDARICAAADACDLLQAYTVDGVTTSPAKYRSALVVPFGAPASDVLDDLAQSMAGSWAFSGGQLYVKPGTFTPSVLSLTEADFAVVKRDGSNETQHPISISVHKERGQKFNAVDITIWDKAQDYKQVTLTPLVSTALKARDGVDLVQPVTMPAVFHAPQAQHIAGIMMREARDPLVVKIPLKMRAYPVQMFDTVDLTVSRYGWSSKLFQVIERVWSSDGGLQLMLKETAAENFVADASFQAQGYAANTNLPNPWYVPTIGTLTISSGTSELIKNSDGTIVSRMRVSWPAVDSSNITAGGYIEIQYRKAVSNGEWTSVMVAGSETQVVISDVQDDVAYVVRARGRNSIAVGLWNVQVSHVVLGKSQLPSTPTAVSLTPTQVYCTKVADLDVAGYLIRAIPAGTGDWTRATPLHTGIVTDFPWINPNRLYGVQTVMVAAIDTSGNVGLPASATLDYGTADSSNTVQTRPYRAETWPGTATNCSVSGGDLVATVNPSSNEYALAELFGEPDVYASTFLAMSWDSSPFVPAYGGGTLSLVYTAVGPSATIEYTIDGDTIVDIYSSSDEYVSSNLFGTNAAFRPWPGAIQAVRMQGVIFRASIGAGAVQGVLSVLTPSLTLPDSSQTFGETAIGIGGARFDPNSGSPTRKWVSIKSVGVTPVVDGSGAVSGRIYDYPPALGPLVELVNSSGVAVAGRALVTVGGLADV